jgi:hypothetical protein
LHYLPAQIETKSGRRPITLAGNSFSKPLEQKLGVVNSETDAVITDIDEDAIFLRSPRNENSSTAGRILQTGLEQIQNQSNERAAVC